MDLDSLIASMKETSNWDKPMALMEEHVKHYVGTDSTYNARMWARSILRLELLMEAIDRIIDLEGADNERHKGP